MYRTLNSAKIVSTIEQLERRIAARFPSAGLAKVCAELAEIARENTARAARLGEPNWVLRLGVGSILLLGLVLMGWLTTLVLNKESSSDLFGTLQGIDSGFNIIVLTGATLFFMFSLEKRTKRRQSLADLHELRSVIHVIDMHQLTKDPSALITGATRTAHSPARTMTPFEITRYLDYCSEMLSLTAKVAALHAQSSTDEVIIDAVNDLERLATDLSQKIWQKITLLEATIRAPAIAAPGHLPSPVQTAPPVAGAEPRQAEPRQLPKLATSGDAGPHPESSTDKDVS